ncbi:cytochrome c oxidase assembly protein COX18, mitochondrial isoform X4 [Hippopotamus amphibius kiboko]|uniref:cytochrome c oxidase assembly protein COX18, mitochondrial isoform X4 n=1 Tax=Hippopotamus amphibius kiboko TaxID=575201 RepID=UPI0025965D56|nr:cytochrome c oxidase assembly protein COX18, mitochondrial isoform X4 [Hippopotamus amphibius kiboko]
MRVAAAADRWAPLGSLVRVSNSVVAQRCCAGSALGGCSCGLPCSSGPWAHRSHQSQPASPSAPLCQCGRWHQSLQLARAARVAGTRPWLRPRRCRASRTCCSLRTLPQACPGGAAFSSPPWPCAAPSRCPWPLTSTTSWPRLTYLKTMRRLVSELYVRDNCHPFKATVLVWIQLPMWIFMSVALRNFSTGATHSEGFSVQEQLATGGVLWFPDLTALDSTWILPVSVGIINLLIVEIFALQKFGMSRFQTYITYFVRAVSVLMIPIAATVPSSIVLYWLCSSFMGLSQNFLLRSPRFRQLCRIPLTKSDSDTPYKDLFAAFYAKFISRK